MKISPSAVIALAGVVATSTAFAPLSTPSRASVGVVNSQSNYDTFRRPVSFLKSTETEEASNAETYEYVLHISLRWVKLFAFVVVIFDLERKKKILLLF